MHAPQRPGPAFLTIFGIVNHRTVGQWEFRGIEGVVGMSGIRAELRRSPRAGSFWRNHLWRGNVPPPRREKCARTQPGATPLRNGMTGAHRGAGLGALYRLRGGGETTTSGDSQIHLQQTPLPQFVKAGVQAPQLTPGGVRCGVKRGGTKASAHTAVAAPPLHHPTSLPVDPLPRLAAPRVGEIRSGHHEVVQHQGGAVNVPTPVPVLSSTVVVGVLLLSLKCSAVRHRNSVKTTAVPLHFTIVVEVEHRRRCNSISPLFHRVRHRKQGCGAFTGEVPFGECGPGGACGGACGACGGPAAVHAGRADPVRLPGHRMGTGPILSHVFRGGGGQALGPASPAS
eukprot:gene23274-biopygen19322